MILSGRTGTVATRRERKIAQCAPGALLPRVTDRSKRWLEAGLKVNGEVEGPPRGAQPEPRVDTGPFQRLLYGISLVLLAQRSARKVRFRPQLSGYRSE